MIEKEKAVAEIGVKFLPHVRVGRGLWEINADGMHYRDLNTLLRSISNNGNGSKGIEIRNVYGQRYIGTDMEKDTEIFIFGTPGNDLGAFMNGASLVIHGNVQDGCGNTMNEGRIVIHGHAGDVTGYSMRGGKIFIRDDVGYRAGIHMKEYSNKRPYLVIGGTAQDFLGEYMAGGVLVVLGLNLKAKKRFRAKFVGTGMHGGVLYVRGEISHIGKEVEVRAVDKKDVDLIQGLVKEFCSYFDFNFDRIMQGRFTKIVPVSNRPYGGLYAY